MVCLYVQVRLIGVAGIPYFTDTLTLSDEARQSPKVEQLSLAVLLGEAIRRIHEGASVSSLFV